MADIPQEPILILAKAGVLLGTPDKPSQGFICALSTTDDRQRQVLMNEDFQFTKSGIEIYIKCLAAGYTAAVQQAGDNNLMKSDEILALLLKYIDIYQQESSGGSGQAIIIATPGPEPSTN